MLPFGVINDNNIHVLHLRSYAMAEGPLEVLVSIEKKLAIDE